MNTRPIKDPLGRLCALEVDMGYAGLKTLASLIGGVEGVSHFEVRPPFARWGERRAKFRFMDVDYVVVEPWGDSSEYWIGPADENLSAPDMSAIEERLRAYEPPVHRKILGDLLTLNFKSLFRR